MTHNLQDFKTWIRTNHARIEVKTGMFLPEFLDIYIRDFDQLETNTLEQFLGDLVKMRAMRIDDPKNLAAAISSLLNTWKVEVERQQTTMTNATTWLNEKFPNQEQKSQIISLTIKDKADQNGIFEDEGVLYAEFQVILEGKLDLSGFDSLRSLHLKNQKLTEIKVDSCQELILLEIPMSYCSYYCDISNNLKLKNLVLEQNHDYPLKILVEKIQQKERELASVREREKQEEINRLGQELQSLRDLKARLESNWQTREEELNGELEQIKREKEELETKLQQSETTLTTAQQELEELKKECQEIYSLVNLYRSLFDFLQNPQAVTTKFSEWKQEAKNKFFEEYSPKEGNAQKVWEWVSSKAEKIVAAIEKGRGLEQLKGELAREQNKS